jgi:hypothetical protein
MSAQDHSPQTQFKPEDGIGIGIAFAAGGIYFILVALGVLPMPGGVSKSPAAIVFAAGAAFLFAGLACVVRARAGMTGNRSELPDSAPRRAQAAYRIAAIAIAGSMAIVGTWIAIGSGPRVFSMTGAVAGPHTTGELIGRTVFALGVVIVWIYAIALTVGTVRKLLDRREG